AEVCGEILGDSEIAHPDRTFALATSGELRGVWDRERMAQVVANLVGNAAKYGEGGAPIAVTVTEAGEGVRLRVHNEGPPIPAEVLPSIFDPFRRGHDHRERAESLGLGLYIVSEIVRAHGGTIEAASTAEEGTTFTVTLPRAAPAPRPGDKPAR
ncbi:MAG TPA: ATP-binding protein, partial [Polyangia bacterium]